MSYFCIFNKRGWLLHEEGVPPSFLNSIIVSLDKSSLSGSKIVRDQKVEYEMRGPIVYLSIGASCGLHSLIDKQKSESKSVEKPNVPKKKEKNRKWNDMGSEEELNYSTVSSIKQKFIDTISVKSVKRTFNLFSNKIHIDELKDKMELHLVKKNVDYKTTKVLTDCVINELREKEFEYVSPDVFKKYMGDVLKKLVPSVDHSHFIQKIRKHEGVFSICFVGVNGVGKSTSLAKICCWLLQNNLKVYVAACDTFRAGAVEQLKIHVERFREAGYDVGFYERGYGKDDASVARTAIQTAQHEGYDVILIDTAGRMHNKKSLMESLSKLIKINVPNHIIYVGEALIGADSLEHIREFNRAVSSGNQDKKIDSILLTKVDTVDDKIGQILNMTFSSHSPIIFLGNGQTNSDLTKIDSEDVVNSLMSS